MGTQHPLKKGHTHPYPVFGPCLLWPDGWMDQDATWYRGKKKKERKKKPQGKNIMVCPMS